MRSIRHRILTASLMALLIVALSMGTVLAEETSGLEPRFGDGRLSVVGNGFKPGEVVTLDAKTDAERRQFTATADAQGHFDVATGMVVKPGSGVELSARGNQGTAKAAITSGPMLLGAGGAAPETSDVGQLPGAGGIDLVAPIAALAVIGLVGAALVLRRSRARS